jgi:hypothetical protein
MTICLKILGLGLNMGPDKGLAPHSKAGILTPQVPGKEFQEDSYWHVPFLGDFFVDGIVSNTFWPSETEPEKLVSAITEESTHQQILI